MVANILGISVGGGGGRGGSGGENWAGECALRSGRGEGGMASGYAPIHSGAYKKEGKGRESSASPC